MTIDINPELYAQVPDAHGRFGVYGGKNSRMILSSCASSILILPTMSAGRLRCTRRRAGQT